MSWLAALHDTSGGTLVAIDGKTLRRSFDKATARWALHLVSAWAVSQKLSLASVAVEDKSNEITAIPELLKLIELSRGDRDHGCDGLSDRDRQDDRRGGR